MVHEKVPNLFNNKGTALELYSNKPTTKINGKVTDIISITTKSADEKKKEKPEAKLSSAI